MSFQRFSFGSVHGVGDFDGSFGVRYLSRHSTFYLYPNPHLPRPPIRFGRLFQELRKKQIPNR